MLRCTEDELDNLPSSLVFIDACVLGISFVRGIDISVLHYDGAGSLVVSG